MAKRKRDLGFTSSEYQEKIFDWVENGSGNAVIEAAAGSGKTLSAVSAMKLIPKTQKCLFIAFNKSIADELNNRLKGMQNTVARTTHSLGFLMLKRNVGSNIEVDEYKYRKYIKTNIAELTTVSDQIKTRHQIEDYIENITFLVNYSRFNLAKTEEEINEVANKYDIPVSFDECAVTKKCLEWGMKNTESVDYTDMVWLPVILDLKPIGLTFDWVFFDESQDASLCTVQLFLKCIKKEGRFVCLGDENQSINMFAGSSEDAFHFLKNYPNTQTFDLPISYRCSKRVISMAHNIVSKIFPRTDAPDGIIVVNAHVRDIKEGDMVLCRSKAPLLKLYAKLLRKKVNCYVKGQDIGTGFIAMLEKIKGEDLNSDLSNDGVFAQLYDKLFSERNKLMKTRGLDYDDATLSSYIMDKYDTINTLLVLSEKLKTKSQLIEHIRNIFKEDSEGVCLSTVHKAKGLEAENVYILCHSSMPSKLASHDWEKLQERNLLYVAYTRAKNKLAFVSEKEIKATGVSQEPMEIINELMFIEQKVCKLLGKEPMKRLGNVELARFKLQNMTEVKDLHEDDNSVEIVEKDKDTENMLDELENLLQ